MNVARLRSTAEAGWTPSAIAARRRMFAQAEAALGRGRDGNSGDARFFVPGRIEVLGKHTDYAGGRSLLCAADQGFCVVSRVRADGMVRVIDAAAGRTFEAGIDAGIEPALGSWTNYPATVIRRFARNFPDARCGCDISFVSDLPPASGMSSSSAFMIAVFLAIGAANRVGESRPFVESISTPEDFAAYLATIENGRTFRALAGDRGVGTFGGSEDHTAILCCRPGALSQYRFGPVVREREVMWPAAYVIVVASSGVVAEKTGAALAAYNRASAAASRVAELWREATGRDDATMEGALASAPDAFERLQQIVAQAGDREFGEDALRMRLEQFEMESRRLVPRAAEALAIGDLDTFQSAVDASHLWGAAGLDNQVPETLSLVSEGRRAGAVAASAFGAGFGGSVWAMVASTAVPAFIEKWAAVYRSQHPEAASRAAFFETRPGGPAVQLDSVD